MDNNLSSLQAGTLLQGGKYRIVRFINSGGFGCTYEAEHVMLENRVAIKEFFVKDFCNRDETTSHVTVGTLSKKALVHKLLRKFVDEARAICKLHHPGIVTVSDIFEENGTAYFVMDYIEGRSLSQMVKSDGPLSEAKALGYIRQVAEALGYVHDHNRLHLDVKPGNIMVDASDRAILIDFGASKQYDEQDGENTSTLMGKTPGYAPLEQMGNDVVRFMPATDIYSLGATLYKLLTGITPLSANLLASGEELPPLPDAVSASTSRAIAAAMQINKNKRPQSIGEFMALLGMGEEPIKKETEEDEETKIDVDEEETKLVAEEPKPAPAPKPQPQPKPTPAPKPELKVTEVTEPKSSSRKTWVISLSVVAVALIWLLWPSGGEDVAPKSTPSRQTSVTQSQPAQVQQSVDSSGWASAPVVVHEETPAPSLLYVTTSPSGATVYVDGKKVGTTPIEGKEIDRGSHTVKISKSGYETISEKKTFGDKSVVFNETLVAEEKKETPVLSLLYVTTSPSGAMVYVDGNEVGTTPIDGKEIERGSHTIKISKSGYETFSENKSFGDKPVVLNETLVVETKKETTVSSGSSLSAKKSVTSNGFSYTINGVSFNMVYVKGGTFRMGATSEQFCPYDWEKPVHRVTLSDYFIGETEVTQALWKAVMGSNPSYCKGDNLPVEKVSWDDCQIFIEKLNQLTGENFRLPTEAEWEYAARGGKKSRGYQYSGSKNLDDVAWYEDNSGYRMHAVKTKKPNELGLYDMSGNVLEWCQDWFGDYSSRAQTNPTGPSSGIHRVHRGGGGNGIEWDCRVSNRDTKAPGESNFYLGLRLSLCVSSPR